MSDCKKARKDFDGRQLNDVSHTSLEEASSLQSDLEALSKQMNEKILGIVEEFALLKKPLFTKRHALLRSVPHFWAVAFMNHPKLKLLINNSVEDCFNYLQYIQVIENDIRNGYQIAFGFDSNPYFHNNKLVKCCTFENDLLVTKKTDIDWKENINLCKEPSKATTGRKYEDALENFFDWLQSNNTDSDIISDIIRDDLWIDPLKYFFALDDINDDHSESDSEEDEDYEDLLDTKDDDVSDSAPNTDS